MQIKTVISESHDHASRLADIALKHRLYVSGWQMSSYLKLIRKQTIDYRVCLAYISDKPISVIIVRKDGFSMFFTKKDYRRKGITSQVVKTVRESGVELKYATDGIIGCGQFYHKINIDYR